MTASDIAERVHGVMPDKFGFLPEVGGDRVECVVIAIAARKNDDTKFHGLCLGETYLFYQSAGPWPRPVVSG